LLEADGKTIEEQDMLFDMGKILAFKVASYLFASLG
jgi:hypothetical protein